MRYVERRALVGISRSAYYGSPRAESPETLAVMRAIDGQFLETPWYGSRQMVRHLRRQGHEVGVRLRRRPPCGLRRWDKGMTLSSDFS